MSSARTSLSKKKKSSARTFMITKINGIISEKVITSTCTYTCINRPYVTVDSCTSTTVLKQERRECEEDIWKNSKSYKNIHIKRRQKQQEERTTMSLLPRENKQ